MNDREFAIHYAKAMLAEAFRRRHSRVNRDFYWTLIGMARNSRHEAAQLRKPEQKGLFA
jgi:hypothetical protein